MLLQYWIPGTGSFKGPHLASLHSNLRYSNLLTPCFDPEGVGVFDGLGGAREATAAPVLLSGKWLEDLLVILGPKQLPMLYYFGAPYYKYSIMRPKPCSNYF